MRQHPLRVRQDDVRRKIVYDLSPAKQESSLSETSEMSGRVSRGIKWMALAQILSQLLMIISNPTLARWLTETDYSLYNIVVTALGFLSVIVGFGFSAAIIQRPTLSDDELHSAFWASAISGGVVCLLSAACMPLISWYYEKPELLWLGVTYSLTFALSPWILVPNAILSRRMTYNKQVIINLCSSILSASATLFYAWLGMGPWSWVLGALTMQIPTAFIAMRVAEFTPRAHFKTQDLKGMREFSFYLTAETACNYLFSNIDYLVISKMLGDVEHGRYTQAYMITHYPYNQFTPPVSRVLFSAFSRQQNDDEALTKSYLEATRSLAILVGPILVFIVIAAEFVIGGYLGDKWLPIIPYVEVLALIGWLKCIVTWVGTVINAKGQTKLGFRWNLICMVFMLIGILIGVQYGTLGVCWAWVIVFIPQAIAIKHITHKMINLPAKRYLQNIFPALLFVVVLWFVMGLLRSVFDSLFGTDRVNLVGFLLFLVWLPVYLLGLRAFAPSVWGTFAGSVEAVWKKITRR
jgi:O-antigen/teichoic acid export membrane protein